MMVLLGYLFLVLFVNINPLSGASLQGVDVLALIDEPINLVATLDNLSRDGFRKPVANRTVRYFLNDKRIGLSRTSKSGTAILPHQFSKPGDYYVTLSISRRSIFKVQPYEILVRVVGSETRFMVVDIEGTLHERSDLRFPFVSNKEINPLLGSLELLNFLAESRSIIYISSSPRHATSKIRDWLISNHYPVGPVLFWNLSKRKRKISEQKIERLRQLRRRFSYLLGGIGNLKSDAIAYQENKMASYLISEKKLSGLPTGSHLFSSWSALHHSLFP